MLLLTPLTDLVSSGFNETHHAVIVVILESIIHNVAEVSLVLFHRYVPSKNESQ